MEAFFEFLAQKGLSEATLDHEVAAWDSVIALDFVRECTERIPRKAPAIRSVFNFVANSQLSGGPYPCARLECREAHAERLARFATLYAETVLIHNPFEKYVRLERMDVNHRHTLADDLHVLHLLRPLLEAGIIGFAFSEIHMCADCYERYIREQKGPWEERLGRLKKDVRQEYLSKTRFVLKELDGAPFVENTGPEGLVDHGCQVTIFLQGMPAILGKRPSAGEARELSEEELIGSQILDHVVSQVVDDIAVQNWYAGECGANYVTDRALDLKLIVSLGGREARARNTALVEALEHSVPYLGDVEIGRLLRLRQEEGEAFRVYRDAIEETLNKVRAATPQVMREAFEDTVRPELNKIDLAVRKARKLLWGSLRRDIVFGAGLIAIGVFSGILPPNIRELVAGVGGLKVLGGLLDKVSRLQEEPTETQQEKFYFLWRVKQESA